MIEHSTENIEDEIEKAGENIDSPDAEKRIMVAGKKVDDLAEEMEKETELKGNELYLESSCNQIKKCKLEICCFDFESKMKI